MGCKGRSSKHTEIVDWFVSGFLVLFIGLTFGRQSISYKGSNQRQLLFPQGRRQRRHHLEIEAVKRGRNCKANALFKSQKLTDAHGLFVTSAGRMDPVRWSTQIH